MIDKYYSYLENSESDAEQQLLTEIIKMLNSPTSQTTHITLDLKIKYHQSFQEFVKKQSEKNSTWKFWSQFVFKDCFAYIGLFLSIRSGNWNLRNGCIKLMGPISSAFDHLTYKKLIASHYKHYHSTYLTT